MAEGPTTGAKNPYALTEVIEGRSIPWTELEPAARQARLERALGRPFDELFDARFDSPVFDSSVVDEVRQRHPSLAVAGPNGRSRPVVGGPTSGSTSTADAGVFFREATEFSDPVQGAAGDCAVIAALASVAWTRPEVIRQQTRATGEGDQQFVDAITFHNGDGRTTTIEVDERVPVVNGVFPFARSSEGGEAWPAMYEKAHAIFLKSPTDKDGMPDYRATYEKGFNPGVALEQLTGLRYAFFGTQDHTADEIWTALNSRSIDGKAKEPLASCTYKTSADAPDDINYGESGIVAWHAYSILGTVQTQFFGRTVILRNPWGRQESRVGMTQRVWRPFDKTFFRTVDLPTDDGVFAIAVEDFKRFYVGWWMTQRPPIKIPK